MAYKNVVKPTSVFDIFEHIVTLLIGGARISKNRYYFFENK